MSPSIPHEPMSIVDANSHTARLVGHEAATSIEERRNQHFLHVAATCLKQTVDGPLGASRVYLWHEPLLRRLVPTEPDKEMGAGEKLRDERNDFHDEVPEFSAYWSSRPLSATMRKYSILWFLARVRICAVLTYKRPQN